MLNVGRRLNSEGKEEEDKLTGESKVMRLLNDYILEVFSKYPEQKYEIPTQVFLLTCFRIFAPGNLDRRSTFFLPFLFCFFRRNSANLLLKIGLLCGN